MSQHTPGLVSILIPVYNERAYLRPCLERIMAAPLPEGLSLELVLVNDCSTDGSDALLEEYAAAHEHVRVFHQPRNMGKGAAIQRAIQELRGEYAIVQDADLEYDPRDYPVLLEPLVQGEADVVYGSRFASREKRKVYNYYHVLGNRLLTQVSNALTGLDLTDMETCYKAFRADLLRTIPIRSSGFEMEPEITAKVSKRGLSIYEVPIRYSYRSYSEGKKIGWKDGVSTLATILRYRVVDDCFEDRYGHEVLSNLAHTRRFNRWTVQTILPWLGQRILEVGAGIGNMSWQLPKREKLLLTDIDQEYLDLLARTYAGNDVVQVCKLDITSDEDAAALGEGVCDTVVCVNVLEFIEDDAGALARMRSLLSPGGRLILLVPQHGGLFGSYDRALGHLRRYDEPGLRRLLEAAGYQVEHCGDHNFLSIPGWWVNSGLLRRRRMDRWQLQAYDLMVPVASALESRFSLPGLSLVCVARAPGTSPS
jgi:glycosyltransferase involved in cell wall biosynthesis